MALKYTTGASCANKAEFFCRIRDFLCARNGTYDYSSTGIGWTIFDSSYAVDEDNPASGDWFVIYSSGENGDDDLYYKFEWISSYIKVVGYLSWNPSTHAGTTSYAVSSGTSNFSVAETGANFPFWINGDLDFVVIHHMIGTTTYSWAVVFGALDPYPGCPGTRDTATCLSALTAGSSVSITVDSVPSDWEVGMPLVIRTTHTNNISTAKIEITTIEAISGNVITCTLSNSYTANSKISSFLGYCCSYSNQGLSMVCTLIDANGGIGTTCYTSSASLSAGYLDPCAYMGKYGIQTLGWINSAAGWPILHTDKVKLMGALTSPMVAGDYVVDEENNYYRIAYVYSGMYVALLES